MMAETAKPDMKYLFEPRSIAVVGASHNPEKIGYKILENIGAGGYAGKVYPVNPEGGEILNLKVYKSVAEIEGEIDLVFLVIPAKFVYDSVKACADKGVKFAAIISSGFSEVGDVENEKRIVSYALEHDMRIIGPNIFGLYIAKSSMNGTFGIKDIMKGGIAIITQSGALGISLMGRTAVERIGLSGMFSLGNKSDVDEADLIDYLVEDEGTKVIMMYVEGIKKGERLIASLKKATKKKPVVVIKAGRSKRGAMAAASHTGSLAGADNVFSDIVKQCGVIRAESINEALDWCKFISQSPMPAGENAVIITNGGGMGVMAADACEKYGVNLFDDAESLKNMFSQVVPPFGSLKNPIDITGQATLKNYEDAINAALQNKDVHSVICLGCETAFFDAVKLSDMIKEIYIKNKPTKPAVFSFFGGAKIDECVKELRNVGIPAFSEVYESVSCLGALYGNYRNVKYNAEDKTGTEIIIDDRAIEDVIKRVRADNRQFLLPQEAESVMTAAQIKMPVSLIAKDIEESVKCAEKIGSPVVMKVVSKDIIHKSDAGGVITNLENKKEVMDAYQAIIFNARKYKPEAKIEGIEVSEMLERDVEVIAGAIRDKSFGPVVMYGLGGVYVEVMGDVAFRSYPLTKAEALNMINETKSSKLLAGVRGAKRKDVPAVIDTIMKLGAVLKNHSDISDIEINPVIVYEEGFGAKALDVRILLSKNQEVKK
jgi:acetyl coenzyme A synthetase (ADP forming)-like protein